MDPKDEIKEALLREILSRPSVLYRPTLFRYPEFGVVRRWRAEYGPCGADGRSPEEAMQNFDEEWKRKIVHDAAFYVSK